VKFDEYEVLKKTFYGFDRQSTILLLLSYDFVCPSTSVDEQKGNQQRKENRVYQSAKHVDASDQE